MSDDANALPAIWDIVVIGGGITGCATARDAAARGLRVLVLERTDLAAGTSGRSTKLLHGGLRYLEHGHLGLVREALREREISARLAPALAVPLRFVMPVWRGAFPGRWAARIGVGLYDGLAGRSGLPRGGGMSAATVESLARTLRAGCLGGVSFYDRQTDDARLTVAIARDAVRRGAVVRLGVEVAAIERTAAGIRLECRDEDGAPSTIDARCAINAAGPWADRVRRLAGLRDPMLRTSRGAHLVLRGLDLDAAFLLPGRRRSQRLFAIPWRGATLFGTTDVDDVGDPGGDDAAIEDLRELFDEVRGLFPAAGLARVHVLSAFTGVRPLIRGSGDTLAVSREHAVRDENGLITIAGGKLTTWRTMAIDVVDDAVRRIGRGGRSPARLRSEPLPGGDAATPDLADVLEHEMVRHVDDVVFRRLPIGHDPAAIRERLPDVLAAMSARLGWDEHRKAVERDRVLHRLQAQARRLDEALGAAN